MVYRTLFLVASLGLALAAGAPLTLAAPVALAFGALAFELFAPSPFAWLQAHPRSIFETRRAGLA